MADKLRCGKIAIVGRGNVGKSTLFNSLMGEKLSIVTKWAGATRRPMTGVLNMDDAQFVLIDTPTFISPRNKLERIMLTFIKKAIVFSDLTLMVVDATFPPSPLEQQLCAKIRKSRVPAFLLLNKMDAVRDFKLEERMEEYLQMFKKTFFQEAMPISALLKENLNFLLKRIKTYLPEREPIYKSLPPPPPQWLMVQEAIREEVTNFYYDVKPQKMEVIVKEIKPPQGKGKAYVLAYLYTDDEKLMPAIIGYKGGLLVRAAHLARLRCERVLGQPVYIDLIVRARKRWRNDIEALEEFGYLKKSLHPKRGYQRR
ncbi:MAG: GTPase Era [bacterium]